jgi:hypothetical protein
MMEDSELIRKRKEKIAGLKEAGIDLYPKTCALHTQRKISTTVTMPSTRRPGRR